MGKLIGYARVSTKQQSTDRQEADLLAAGVRHDDLYIDRGVSGARASRPQFDRALKALIEGDVLVITTLDRLGRSTQNMLAFADVLGARGAGLRVLNLGGENVDTSPPPGPCCLRSWPRWQRWNIRSSVSVSPTRSRSDEQSAKTWVGVPAGSLTVRSATP